MARLVHGLAALALIVAAGCDKGSGDGDGEGEGGGGGASGYAPTYTSAMFPEGFGTLMIWDSSLDDARAAFPEANGYRVMELNSPVYDGQALAVNAQGEATLPAGARNITFHFEEHDGQQRLMRVDISQPSDAGPSVCDWLVETIGAMGGAEEGCIDEHISRGVRDSGAMYCVGTPDGSRRVDMECRIAAAGAGENSLMIRVPAE